MSAKTKVLISLIVLGIIDAVLPLIPVLAIILIYVMLEKPPWFMDLVRDIYDH